MSKKIIIETLTELFRSYGYEGTSLSRIAEATNLGKASLYHHFPGGKEQMAKCVLDQFRQDLNEKVVGTLTGPANPKDKLTEMCSAVAEFFYGGHKWTSLFDALSIGDAQDLFREGVSEALEDWLSALEQVGQEAGLSKKSARDHAEDVLITIQGSLVVSRCAGNSAPFKRVLSQVPERFLQES